GGPPRQVQKSWRRRPMKLPVDMVGILRSSLFELNGNLFRQLLRRDDAREGTEAQNPALKRAIEADVEGHAEAAGLRITNLLRRMPLARADVVGDRRLKF